MVEKKWTNKKPPGTNEKKKVKDLLQKGLQEKESSSLRPDVEQEKRSRADVAIFRKVDDFIRVISRTKKVPFHGVSRETAQ